MVKPSHFLRDINNVAIGDGAGQTTNNKGVYLLIGNSAGNTLDGTTPKGTIAIGHSMQIQMVLEMLLSAGNAMHDTNAGSTSHIQMIMFL